MAQYLFLTLIGSLLLTLVTELLFALVWGLRRNIWIVIMMNIITNPVVVSLHFLISRFTVWNLPVCIFLLEVSAVVAEALYCRKLVPHPWRFSFCINLVSFFTGCLLQWI